MFRHRVFSGMSACLLAVLLGLFSPSALGMDGGKLWTWSYGEFSAGQEHYVRGEYAKAAVRYRSAATGFERLLRDSSSWRTDLVILRLAYSRVMLTLCESKEHPGVGDSSQLRILLRRLQSRNESLSKELGYVCGVTGQGGSLWKAHQALDTLQGAYDTQAAELIRIRLERDRLRKSLASSRAEVLRLREARSLLGKVLSERDELSQRLSEAKNRPSECGGESTAALKAEVARLGQELGALRKAESERVSSRRRALAAEIAGDGASAARYWHLCGLRGGDGLSCWTRSAYWYWQVGEREKSQACLDRLFKLFAEESRFLGMLSRIRLSLGDRDGAMSLGGLCVRSDRKDVSGLVSLGAVFLDFGVPGLSERYLRRALSLSPRDREALLCLASLLSAQGASRKAEALGYYKSALSAGASREAGLDAYFGLGGSSAEKK